VASSLKASFGFGYSEEVDVIEVQNLSKDYRQHFWTPVRRVLDSVSFSVKKGEIFGFLGPNGSGKSTTIKILFEIIFPTAGEAKLFGKPLGDKSSKARIGFLPENPYFYDYLTSEQFLTFHGRLLGLDVNFLEKRIPEVLDLVGMRGTTSLHLRNFSKGMLQRIGLAQAIVHDPDLVILDEPMTGLDPVGRKEVRDLMVHLQEQGKTVFFSTHILSDVETVCDRVAILNKGKLLKCGSLDELISVDTKYVDMVWTASGSGLEKYFKTLDTKLSVSTDSLYLKLEPKQNEDTKNFEGRVNDVIQKGIAAGGKLHSLSPKKETLEDVFVKQVGNLENRI
jgi:ABC-2 type transport system ATP-binding protein